MVRDAASGCTWAAGLSTVALLTGVDVAALQVCCERFCQADDDKLFPTSCTCCRCLSMELAACMVGSRLYHMHADSVAETQWHQHAAQQAHHAHASIVPSQALLADAAHASAAAGNGASTATIAASVFVTTGPPAAVAATAAAFAMPPELAHPTNRTAPRLPPFAKPAPGARTAKLTFVQLPGGSTSGSTAGRTGLLGLSRQLAVAPQGGRAAHHPGAGSIPFSCCACANTKEIGGLARMTHRLQAAAIPLGLRMLLQAQCLSVSVCHHGHSC